MPALHDASSFAIYGSVMVPPYASSMIVHPQPILSLSYADPPPAATILGPGLALSIRVQTNISRTIISSFLA